MAPRPLLSQGGRYDGAVLAVPYELISAVQDLYDLYQRIGPAGHYKLSLFHNSQPVGQTWPEPVQLHAPRLDELARGVSCLLANGLIQPAPPVCGELWRGVLILEGALRPDPGPLPEYYRYLSRELSKPGPAKAHSVYRLFGEVLAVYLDVLAAAQGSRGDWEVQVRELRRAIIEARD